MVAPVRQPFDRSAPHRNALPDQVELTHLTITSTGEAISLVGTYGYMAFWDSAVPPARKGYIQNVPGALIINAEGAAGGSSELQRDLMLLASRSISVQAPLGLSGSNKLYWPTYGGTQGIWMQDTTWVRIYPNVYTSGILAAQNYVVAGGSTQVQGGMALNVWGSGRLTGGLTVDSAVSVGANLGVGTSLSVGASANIGTALDVAGGLWMHNIMRGDLVYQGASWPNWQWEMIQGTGGSIGIHIPGVYAAAIRVYDSFNRLDVVDAADGYTTIGVLNVAYPSSITVKDNIVTPDDETLLKKLFWVQVKQFERKRRPITPRKSERFRDINARWTAKGKKELTVPVTELANAIHDCSIDDCVGSPEAPCMAWLNHKKDEHGLIAEELFELFPDAISLNNDAEPEGILSTQVHSIAIGGVAALTRTVVSLIQRIETLEGAT